MQESGIETRLVCGFLDAGKTTYIRECIQNDYFYKYGRTLILCFEQGEAEYDEDELAAKNTKVAYFDGDTDVGTFCMQQIETHRPDRIYVEMNAMMQELRERLPRCMQVSFVVTWLDWQTLPLYFANFRQMIRQMASSSHQVVFRGCPSRELLSPYSQAFRLMNQKATYLRQDPMGYHEKAFDLFLPFSLEDDEITIPEASFLPLWLDALDHPEHYAGKTLHFKDALELRRVGQDETWSAGRVVMICCMADLQFMAFALENTSELPGGWITLDAVGELSSDAYGRARLTLRPIRTCRAAPPDAQILDLSRMQPDGGAS